MSLYVVIVGRIFSGGATIHGPFNADEAEDFTKWCHPQQCETVLLRDVDGNIVTKGTLHKVTDGKLYAMEKK